MNRKKEDRAARLYSAIGGISPSFVEEAENYTAADETAKTTGKTSRVRVPAPAWLRPVAACLAVLILGGLVVFSIPVVNNIISHRGPAELPGTDVAEADTTEETKKKEETEAPVETEEIEVSQFDKIFTVGISKTVINKYGNPVEEPAEFKSASFNDIIKDEHRMGVATAKDAEKITVGMTIFEVNQILGAEGHRVSSLIRTWALDDGRSICVYLQYSFDTKTHEPSAGWNEEYAPISQIIFTDESKTWEIDVKAAIQDTGHYYYTLGLIPEWGK